MNRFITMFRGGMVTLIYSRALLLKDGVYEESAAISLMSNDVDQISDCLEELNEVWSRTIEIGIGLPLLTLQLGWVSIIPLLVVFSELTNFLHFSLANNLKSPLVELRWSQISLEIVRSCGQIQHRNVSQSPAQCLER
jgi:hypothetical protein